MGVLRHDPVVKLFCCQLDVAWEDKTANFTKASALLDNASPTPGSLVVLPEMFATGFTMNVGQMAEPPEGATSQFLSGIARKFRAHVMGGLVTRGADGKCRNQAVIFSPDGLEVTRYSKIHPFSLGGEAVACAAGNQITTFRWNEVLVAPFVCYDLRFPEVFRQAAWQRPQLYTVIASWPEARIGHWVKLLQARAVENQAFVVGVNRIGRDPKLNHTGRSMIIDHNGDILSDAGGNECVISAELDFTKLDEYRRSLPFLDDMRPEEVRQNA